MPGSQGCQTSAQASSPLALGEIVRSWERGQALRDWAAAKEKKALLDEIESLKIIAARVDVLDRENDALRACQSNVPSDVQIKGPGTSPGLVGDASVVSVRAAQLHAGEAFVSRENYTQLKAAYERLISRFELQKRQAERYKAAAIQERQVVVRLTEKVQRCKDSVKTWQEYADKIIAMCAAAKEKSEAAVAGAEEYKMSLIPTTPSTVAPDDPHEASSFRMDLSTTTTKGESSKKVLRDDNNLQNPVVQSMSLGSVPQFRGLAEVHPQMGRSTDIEQWQDNPTVPVKLNPVQVRHNASPLTFGVEETRSNESANSPKDLPLEMHSDDIFDMPSQHNIAERPSSQTTEDEQNSNRRTTQSNAPTEALEHEEPQFLSIRSLKRKRPRETYASTVDVESMKARNENGSSRKPFTVKSEADNSSPLGLPTLARLHHEQSLDLDEVPGDVETPKKIRLREMLYSSLPKKLGNDLYRTRSASMPPEVDNISHQLSDSFEAEISHHSSRDQAGPESTHWIKRENLDEPLDLHDAGGKSGVTSKPNASMQQHRGSNVSRVLQPLNANKQVAPRTSSPRSLRKPTRDRRPFPVGELTEDGERYSRRVANGPLPISSDSDGTAKPRLKSLLEMPSPNRQMLELPVPQSAIQTRPSTRQMPTPGTPVSVVRRPLPNRQSITPNAPVTAVRRSLAQLGVNSAPSGRRNQVLLREPDVIVPEDEPLRARPLQRLCLDDFKVNPTFNQGYDYAFVEVVRNREQRHCLPGCTRPECCGDRFRKMIELGGALPAPANGLWDSSEGDADERLLAMYLGEDSSRLQRMSAKQKDELLIQARAEQLAQKHGKHRQSYQRSGTPPGFWRTDMPNTQEEVEDRETSRKMERTKVEERYREAMRGGGQWLFRDE